MIGTILARYATPALAALALAGAAGTMMQTLRLSAMKAELQLSRVQCQQTVESIAAHSKDVAKTAEAKSLSARVAQLQSDLDLSVKANAEAKVLSDRAAAMVAKLKKDRENEAASDAGSCLLQPLSPDTRRRLHEADEAGSRIRYP